MGESHNVVNQETLPRDIKDALSAFDRKELFALTEEYLTEDIGLSKFKAKVVSKLILPAIEKAFRGVTHRGLVQAHEVLKEKLSFYDKLVYRIATFLFQKVESKQGRKRALHKHLLMPEDFREEEWKSFKDETKVWINELTKLDEIAISLGNFQPKTTLDLVESEDLGKCRTTYWLEPYNSFVPFLGRDEWIATLLNFCEVRVPFLWMVITGEGGVGKTRLMHEFCKIKKEDGWSAGFLAADSLEHLVNNPGFGFWTPLIETLIVVDYAANKTEKMKRLMTRIARWSQEAEQEEELTPLRLVLLERDASKDHGWLATLLATGEGKVKQTIDRAFRVTNLKPPFKEDAPQEYLLKMLNHTFQVWAKIKQTNALNLSDLHQNDIDHLLTITKGNPLFVQMAGIEACEEGNTRGLLHWTKGDILKAVVKKERKHILNNSPYQNMHKFIERAAALLCLSMSCEFDDPEWLRVVGEDLRDCGYLYYEPIRISEALLEALGKKSTAGDRTLLPISPDILGEAFAVSVLKERENLVSPTLRRLLKYAGAEAYDRIFRTSVDLLEVFGFDFAADWILKLAKEGPDSAVSILPAWMDILRRLSDSAANMPGGALRIIRSHVLPECLKASSDKAIDRFGLKQVRQLLRDWIEQYDEDQSIRLRDEIMDSLLKEAANSEHAEGSIMTLCEIGYRSHDVEERLWKVARQRNGENSDLALATLSYLGVTKDKGSVFLESASRLIEKGFSHSLLFALSHFAHPDCLDFVERELPSPKKTTSKESCSVSGEEYLRLGLLAEVADRYPSDLKLQERIWKNILDVVRTDPSVYNYNRLLLGRNLAPRVNTSKVVDFLINYITLERREVEGQSNRRWLASLRLQDCKYPRHLAGLDSPLSPSQISALEQEACKDTCFSGRDRSDETLYKETTWDVLLLTGRPEVFEFYEKALSLETNAFVAKRLNELMASFQLNTVPHVVQEILLSERGPLFSGDSREFARWISCVQVTLSAGTVGALELLLRTGLKEDGGKVYNLLGRAVSELTEFLSEGAEVNKVKDILIASLQSNDLSSKILATIGLESIAVRNALSEEEVGILEHEVDKAKEPLLIGALASCFGFILGENLSDTTWVKLRELTTHSDKWISSNALDSLARQDRIECDNSLLKYIGLELKRDKWCYIPPGHSNIGFYTACLYHFHPDQFLKASVDILEIGDSNTSAQWLHWFSHFEKRPLDHPLKQALLKRTRDKQSPADWMEPTLFKHLAYSNPKDLASEPWEESWEDWDAQSKEALADALKRANISDARIRARAIAILFLISGSGSYSTRRAAFDAIAHREANALLFLIQKFHENRYPCFRVRGAEALGWIPSAEAYDDAFDDLYKVIKLDRDRRVRKAAYNSWFERRNRTWCMEYLKEVVRATQSGSNKAILKALKYGQALVGLADKSVMDDLVQQLKPIHLKPNDRHWISRLLEEWEQDWKNTIKKWPKATVYLKGGLTEGSNSQTLKEEPCETMNYWLWSLEAPLEERNDAGVVSGKVAYTQEGRIFFL